MPVTTMTNYITPDVADVVTFAWSSSAARCSGTRRGATDKDREAKGVSILQASHIDGYGLHDCT